MKMGNDFAKTDTTSKSLTVEERQAHEIEELRVDLIKAYKRIDDLRIERLTVWKVIQRGKYDEQLQIIETNTTPQGIVVFVS